MTAAFHELTGKQDERGRQEPAGGKRGIRLDGRQPVRRMSDEA